MLWAKPENEPELKENPKALETDSVLFMMKQTAVL